MILTKEDVLLISNLNLYSNEKIIQRFLIDNNHQFNLSFEDGVSLFEDLKLFLFVIYKYQNKFNQNYLLTDQLQLIDSFWHTFLLFTTEYKAFCLQFFGSIIEHSPESEGSSSNEKNIATDQSILKLVEEQFQFTVELIGAERTNILYNPNINFFKKLPVEVRSISKQELDDIQSRHFNSLFENRVSNKILYNLTDDDKVHIHTRKSKILPDEIILGAFYKGDIVGWCYGVSTDCETIYMQNSGVVSSYQNKGVYSSLLNVFIVESKKLGFQVITSLHHSNNKAVLIPKLKQGFFVTGSQFNERFGYLIELKYFFDNTRRLNFVKRMGLEL